MTTISTHNVSELSSVDKRTLEGLLGESLQDDQQVVVTAIASDGKCAPKVSLKSLFGSVQSGDSHSADNDRIDTDLARGYGDSLIESRD